jgi:hypothetical protein
LALLNRLFLYFFFKLPPLSFISFPSFLPLSSLLPFFLNFSFPY